MDKKFLKKKGLLEAAERFNYIMEYVTATDGTLAEVDANMDGLDDATGMADPAAAGGAAPMDPMAGGAMAADPNAAAGAMPADPNAAAGAMPADPNAAGGVPGFNPQAPAPETDAPATATEGFDEATPDEQEGGDKEQGGDDDEEVIDVDELVDGQKRNEEAIEKLTDKFEKFLEKFSEFQGELKSNAEFMSNLENEFEKRNPTSIEKMSMRSIQSKPFGETPEEYMKYHAPSNYSPEDDNNGVDEPRYTITRDDVRNSTDYADIAKTLRDNSGTSLKDLLGL